MSGETKSVVISVEEKSAKVDQVRSMSVPDHNVFSNFHCDGSGQPPKRVEFGEVGNKLPAMVFGLCINLSNFPNNQSVVGMECSKCSAAWVTPASNIGQLAKLR